MYEKSIIIAGSAIADVQFKIDYYPKIGNLARLEGRTLRTGGTTNIIKDFARLDPSLPLIMSGLVGKDELGLLIKKELSKYNNIDDRLVFHKGDTAVSYVYTEIKSKKRTFFYAPGNTETLSEEHIKLDSLTGSIFHLEYLLCIGQLDMEDKQYGTRGARLLHEAQKKGMKTSIDVTSESATDLQKIVIPSLKYTNYCIINEVEAEGITNISLCENGKIIEIQIKKALIKLKDAGVNDWVIIHSPTSNYGYDCINDEFIKVESAKLPEGFIKGTTGAGDAFCCGVLYGAYHNYSLYDAMQLGVICATCSLSEEDNCLGIKPLNESIDFFNKININ